MKQGKPGGHQKAKNQPDFAAFKNTMKRGGGQKAKKSPKNGGFKNTMKSLIRGGGTSQKRKKTDKGIYDEAEKYRQETENGRPVTEVRLGGGREAEKQEKKGARKHPEGKKQRKSRRAGAKTGA